MAEDEKARFPWLAASLVLGVALTLYNWLGGHGGANPAYNVSYALGNAVLAWAVLFIFGLRRSGAPGILGSFGVLWAMAFAGLLMSSPQIEASQDSAGRLSEKMTTLIDQTTDNTLTRIEDIEAGPQRPGMKGQLSTFATAMFNEMIAIQNEYIAELTVIGWDTVLDPARLKADPDMTQSAQMLTQARDAATRLCAQQERRLEAKARQVVSELTLRESDRKTLFQSFMRGMEEKAPVRAEICRLEVAIIDEVGEVLFVLAGDPNWVHEDGMFLFSDDQNVETFNTHWGAIQTMSAKQKALQKDAMTEAQQGLRAAGF